MMAPGRASHPAVRGGDLSGSILLLSNYYHPEPTGSAPPITDLSLWLAQNNLRPDVIVARPSYPHNKVYEGYEDGQHDREVFSGVNVRRVKSYVANSRGVIGRLLSESSFALAALFAKRRRYRGIICVCPSVFTVLAAPSFKARDGRVVAIVHDIQSGLAAGLKFGAAGVLMGALQRLEAWALNRCDEVVALSPAMASELKIIGVRTPIIVIPPQVDVSEISPIPHATGAIPTVVYSGNLGRKQGLEQVLGLAKELLHRGSTARLIIRGEGSERRSLEEKAMEDGLTNLTFSGLAPREEISAALGEATLHIVPQSPGGANFALPSKIFSIMAAERAFVATASVGTPLYNVTKESGGGVCVEPDNPKVFADMVENLLNDHEARLQLGRAGRAYAETVIDREVVCRNILKTLVPEQ